ncbi:MAG: PQQ-binding-like beta-propeller repeat protein, partial [bacterium]
MVYKNGLQILIQAAAGFMILAVYAFALNVGCSGGHSDPLGVIPDKNQLTGEINPSDRTGVADRVIWGAYYLDFRPDEGIVELIPPERNLDTHFNVTSFVKKPACPDCLKLSNASFNQSSGVFDLDATLTNPTQIGAFDVRGVLLIDEWGSSRRLENAHGLTDFWSHDPWHPDPFLNFAREKPDRYFGPGEQYSNHVTISFPAPYDFKVPFIVDASYPDHPQEPVELMNIKVEGSVHPTGYDLHIEADVLDWQNDTQEMYLDCSPLNQNVGIFPMSPLTGDAAGSGSSTWSIDLVSHSSPETWWLPTVEGEIELPIVARDNLSDSTLVQRIKIDVTPDSDPPQWTGDVGIQEVWWGGSRAIVSFYPATDTSGPVLYNIYVTSDFPMIPPSKCTVTGNAHYTVEIADGANYQFVVRAQDQAGNEDDNDLNKIGQSKAMTTIWEKVFTADLGSSPTICDMNLDETNDVIFGCDDGNVYSLNGGTGETQWFFETEAPVKCTAAIQDVTGDEINDVVIGSNDSKIYALGTVFGMPFAFLTFNTSNIVESSPVCADQTGDNIAETIVGSFDGHVYAFEGGSGDLLVDYDSGSSVIATPSLEDFNGDGFVDIVLSSGGVVRAINGVTGLSMWSKDFETGYTEGSPAIGDLTDDGVGDVVLGVENKVYALNVKDKSVIWAVAMDSGDFDTSPALGDFTGDGIPDVVISSRFEKVFLLDGEDGSLIWESDDDIYLPTSPALADMNADGIIDIVIGSA